MNTIIDYIFETEHRKNIHNVFEMLLISDSKDNLSKNTKIYVYGENDEQGTKPPHFHIKMDNRYEFEIKFDDFNSKIFRASTPDIFLLPILIVFILELSVYSNICIQSA